MTNPSEEKEIPIIDLDEEYIELKEYENLLLKHNELIDKFNALILEREEEEEIVAGWTEEDDKRNKIHPGWEYVKPFSKILQAVQERNPNVIPALIDAHLAEDEFYNIPASSDHIKEFPTTSEAITQTTMENKIKTDSSTQTFRISLPPSSFKTTSDSSTQTVNFYQNTIQSNSSRSYTGTISKIPNTHTKPKSQTPIITHQTPDFKKNFDPDLHFIPQTNFDPQSRPNFENNHASYQKFNSRRNFDSPQQCSSGSSFRKNDLNSFKRLNQNDSSSNFVPTKQQKLLQENQNIPSLFDVKVEAPSYLGVKIIKWLDEDCRHGCWNCKERDHTYENCIHPKRGLFCFNCGLPNYKINNCPNCKEMHQNKKHAA